MGHQTGSLLISRMLKGPPHSLQHLPLPAMHWLLQETLTPCSDHGDLTRPAPQPGICTKGASGKPTRAPAVWLFWFTANLPVHISHPWRRKVSFLLESEIQLSPCRSRLEALRACLAVQVLCFHFGMHVDVCAFVVGASAGESLHQLCPQGAFRCLCALLVLGALCRVDAWRRESHYACPGPASSILAPSVLIARTP